MPRKRIDGPAITSYEQADAVLRQLGDLEREIELSNSATEEGIAKLRDSHKAYCEPRLATKSTLERQLKEFAESRRADFADTRTRELVHGSLGFRRSSAVVIKKIGDTLAALKALQLTHCIRTKEEPDKEAMRELSTETLTNVGAALVVKDAFGYELRREPELTGAA